MPSSLRLWSSEAEIGWHWPMLVLSSVLLTDHTRVSYYQLGTVADACQDQRRGFLFTSTFSRVRESQRLQWSRRFAKSLGQAANFEVQPTKTTATTTQLRSLRCKYLNVGAQSATWSWRSHVRQTSFLLSLYLIPRRWRARKWAISARVLAPLFPDCNSTASNSLGPLCHSDMQKR